MKPKKNQKPIEIDAHLKYVCDSCGLQHWVSLKQASTKQFIVVCDCNNIFGVKTIKRLKVCYNKRKQKPEPVQEHKQTQAEKTEQQTPREISKELLEKSINVLSTFGFTKKESESMIINAYSSNPIDDCVNLVKYSLSKIGVSNEQ